MQLKFVLWKLRHRKQEKQVPELTVASEAPEAGTQEKSSCLPWTLNGRCLRGQEYGVLDTKCHPHCSHKLFNGSHCTESKKLLDSCRVLEPSNNAAERCTRLRNWFADEELPNADAVKQVALFSLNYHLHHIWERNGLDRVAKDEC